MLQSIGNNKNYHMDIEDILGKDPNKTEGNAVQTKKRIDIRTTKSAAVINKYSDEIDEGLDVS